jgi:hypothetical protein
MLGEEDYSFNLVDYPPPAGLDELILASTLYEVVAFTFVGVPGTTFQYVITNVERPTQWRRCHHSQTIVNKGDSTAVVVADTFPRVGDDRVTYKLRPGSLVEIPAGAHFSLHSGKYLVIYHGLQYPSDLMRIDQDDQDDMRHFQLLEGSHVRFGDYRFEPITKLNLAHVCRLRTTPEQSEFVDHPGESIAKCSLDSLRIPLAIYFKNEIIAFTVVQDAWANPDKHNLAYIHDFFIDHSFQRQGHGGEILKHVVQLLRNRNGDEPFSIKVNVSVKNVRVISRLGHAGFEFVDKNAATKDPERMLSGKLVVDTTEGRGYVYSADAALPTGEEMSQAVALKHVHKKQINDHNITRRQRRYIAWRAFGGKRRRGRRGKK